MEAEEKRTLDVVFDALTEQRRRIILRYLQDNSPATIDELRAQILRCEPGRSPNEGDVDQYESIDSNLHHSHLPRLADLGLIEYDARSGNVVLDDRTPVLDRVLSCTADFDDVNGGADGAPDRQT